MYTAVNKTSYVSGTPVRSENVLQIKSPYDNRIVGSVTLANKTHSVQAIEMAIKGGKKLSRYERYSILEKTRQLLIERKEEFAQTISAYP